MIYILTIIMLVTSIKQLFNGGLFVNTIKKLIELNKTKEYTSGDLADSILMLLSMLVLISVEIYLYCIGLSVEALFIPTLIFVLWKVLRGVIFKGKIDDLGKFTFGSFLEDLLRISYWAYFLYVICQ